VRELNVVPHPSWPFDPRDHCLEFMFAADFVADHGDAHEEDEYQLDVVWHTPDELERLRFYPQAALPHLRQHLDGGGTGLVYLGAVS
jgi:hypothetical protein